MTTVQSKQDVALMAHLLRRAGFGATAKELDHYMGMSYEEAVEDLLSVRPEPNELPVDLIRRYHVDQSDLRTARPPLPNGSSGWSTPTRYSLKRCASSGTASSQPPRPS